jgi:hypothetical protein
MNTWGSGSMGETIPYPEVHGEFETLKKIRKGFSIARFGDGEIGVSTGNGYTREPKNGKLSAELKNILHTFTDKLLIGIPTMDPKGCKYKNWSRHIDRYSKLIPPGREYYSALISRPDCGPWLRTIEYAQAVQSIWLGKSVTFVGSEIGRNKMQVIIEKTEEVTPIECLWYNAYSEIDDLEKKVLDAGNDLAILSCGVTATCLAGRLAPHVQAVDIGSIGGFLAKMLFADKWASA